MTSSSSTLAAGASTPAPAHSRRVVDAPTRMFHWLFALSFAGAWLTGDGERWRALHVVLGYTMAGLLAFRIVYGLVGPRHARLGLTWRRLAVGVELEGERRDLKLLGVREWWDSAAGVVPTAPP